MNEMLEYAGVASGLLYLFLEIKQLKAMWIVGFITSLVYVFVFLFAKIYADMGLQIYYVLISIYGFWKWNSTNAMPQVEDKSKEGAEKRIEYRSMTPALFIWIMMAILVLYILIFGFLKYFTDSPIASGDALTTSVGIVATWMVAQKIIEHWIFWFMVNILSAYIYYIRDLYPTMFLYVCYAILAVVGLIMWKNKGIKINDNRLSMRNRS